MFFFSPALHGAILLLRQFLSSFSSFQHVGSREDRRPRRRHIHVSVFPIVVTHNTALPETNVKNYARLRDNLVGHLNLPSLVPATTHKRA